MKFMQNFKSDFAVFPLLRRRIGGPDSARRTIAG